MLQAVSVIDMLFSTPKSFSPLGGCFILQISSFKIQMITDKIQIITDTPFSYNCDTSASVAKKPDISAIIYI